MPMLKSKNQQTKIIKINYRSIRHTDYSHSKTETQKTPILCQSQFIKQWTRPTHWLVMIDTETTPILTQTHRLLSFSLDTWTTLILTQTHGLLLSFSHRHTDNSHSCQSQLINHWYTDYSYSPQTHRLLPFSHTHTYYSHSHSHTDWQTTPILTHRLLSFSHRHTANSQ